VALASSCSVVNEKEVSSAVEPRSTGPVTTGASLTGLMVRSAPAAVELMVPLQTSMCPWPSETP